MSVQDVRLQLASILRELLEEDGWTVTTATRPEFSSPTVVVGHARTIDPDTYRSYEASLNVTLWVNEGDDADSAAALYALVSPGAQSLIQFLSDHPTFKLAGPVRAGNVGPRDEGPTGFLVAELIVPAKVS